LLPQLVVAQGFGSIDFNGMACWSIFDKVVGQVVK
jgi:hypothetical protein